MGTDATPGAGARFSHRDYAELARLDDEALLRDCDVQVFRATGPGGQGVNTTDSAVRMRHVPTGVTVTARESRSQYRNRMSCLDKLRAVFVQRARRKKPRKKTKPPRSVNERRLEGKRRRAGVKAARRSVDW